MKISKRIIKGIALSMCALILSLSISSACLPVYAEEMTLSASELSLKKLVDMSLTNTGIVANADIIDTIVLMLLDDWDSISQAYKTYCEDGTLDIGVTSLSEYMASDGYTFTGYNHKKLQELVDIGDDANIQAYFDGATSAECIVEYAVGDRVHGGGGRRREFTIDNNFVVYVRQLFNEYSETDADFYYIDTISPKNINPLWFKVKADYDNFCNVLKNANGYLYLDLSYGSKGTLTFDSSNSYSTDYYKVYGFRENFYLLDNGYDKTQYYYRFLTYNDNWVNEAASSSVVGYNSAHSYTTEEELINMGTIGTVKAISSHLFIPDISKFVGLCSSDGRKVRVFNNLDALKLFSVGVQEYYITNDSDEYVTNNDNSVTFSGDYYTSTGDEYTYDVVQNEIDNSTEINEETVNNIVNEQTTTIINNYYTSSGDSGEGDSSDNSTGSVTDLISAVGGFLEMIISVLSSLISLLTTFINSALSLIGGLGETFAGFSTLLGSLFVFIPQELIDAIGSGIMLLVVLAIYKALRK